jgi:hypothetical protein
MRPDRCRIFAPVWPVLAGGEGAQIIYSAAAERQWALRAGAVSPHYLLPLRAMGAPGFRGTRPCLRA